MADPNLYAQARTQLPSYLAAVQAAKGEQKLYATSALVRLIGTLAANAPDMAQRAAWLVQYKALVAQEAALPKPDYGDPAPWLKALDRFSDSALAVGRDVLNGVTGTVAGVAGLAKALPILTVVALVLAAVVLVKVGPQLFGAKGRK